MPSVTVPPAAATSRFRERVAVQVPNATDLDCQNVKDRFRALRALLEERVRGDRPEAGYHGAIAELMSPVSLALMSCGQEADRSMASFFEAFSELVVTPGCTAARTRAVRAAERVADQFLAITRELTDARRRADRELRRAVGELNALSRQLAALNIDLRRTSTRSTRADTLREQRRRLLHDLSHFITVEIAGHPDGAIDVSFGPRRPLVLGGSAVPITESRTPSARYRTLSSGGVVVGGDITSGRVGGWLQVRDVLLPRDALRLDTLAHAFVTRVNAVHLAGLDAAGARAGHLFVPMTAIAGAAGAVSVEPGVAANPTLVAAARAFRSDSQTAVAIAALRHQITVGGARTFAEAWTHIVACAAHDAQAAHREQQSHDGLVRQMQSLYDNLPVSISATIQETHTGRVREPEKCRRGCH
jgi:flagellar hook-associated protein FlgK